MRRLSLSTLLIAVNAALVLMAVVIVVGAAIVLIRNFADQEGLDRARLALIQAMASAAERTRAAAAGATRLANDPGVRAHLEPEDAPGLAADLEAFRRSGDFSACAILRAEKPVIAIASAGPVRPTGANSAGAGSAVAGSSGASGEPAKIAASSDLDPALVEGIVRQLGPAAEGGRSGYVLARPPLRGGTLFAAALAPLLATSGSYGEALVMVPIEEAFARPQAAESGARIQFLDREHVLGHVVDEGAGLRAKALASDEPVASRLENAGTYLAAEPVRDGAGELVGLVEAELPRSGFEGPARRLIRNLVLVSAGVVALGVLASLILARRLRGPLEELTAAGSRIGRGDLTTPISAAPGSEAGTLAATMDEMRGRLLRLTDELKNRRAAAESILSGIVEGVFTVDRERRIRYMNPQAAALLGLKDASAMGAMGPPGVIGQFCGDVLRPIGPDGVRPCEDHCPILHARFRGHAGAPETLQRADGTQRAVVITSAAPSGSGDLGKTDDTQFQLLRDETDLEATRRLRDTILANISHEFRTPLSAQLASIELLRDTMDRLTPDQTRQLVLSLERGALRLTQLIDNLLESVRIEAGRTSVRLQPVALDEVVEQAVEMTDPLLAQKEQTLDIALPSPPPHVMGDSPRLVQVFVNLLANANKFAPRGSTIRVAGIVRASDVLLWVEDDGPGLPPGDDEAAIFDRFVRSPRAEPEQSGLGLGLWIVKSIVERHGGGVEARVGSGGGGTRMCVRLPIHGPGSEA